MAELSKKLAQHILSLEAPEGSLFERKDGRLFVKFDALEIIEEDDQWWCRLSMNGEMVVRFPLETPPKGSGRINHFVIPAIQGKIEARIDGGVDGFLA